MYTVPTMHATFVVHYWVNMKPLNRTQPSNLQLCSNQSTNHNSWFGVRGPQPRVTMFVDRSLAVTLSDSKYFYDIITSSKGAVSVGLLS